MRISVIVTLALTLLVVGCKPRMMPIPTAMVDKAAYCAAVTLQRDPEVKYPENAIQYLVYGSLKDGHVDEAAYRDVVSRQQAFSKQLGKNKAAVLPEACLEAFPGTDPVKTFTLSDDPKERLLGCDALLQAMGTGLKTGQGPKLDKAMHDEMATEFAENNAAAIAKKQITLDDANAMRARLLPTMLNLGNSYAVTQVCWAAYPRTPAVHH
jgi:hypothetical protein